MKNKENIAVYISSFDGYKDLWPVFFEIFFRYWNECPYPIYLVNNIEKYEKDRVQVLHSGNEIDWFIRTIKTLEEVKEEYIIFMLEDYFISKKIRENDINCIVEQMEKEKIFYYRLSKAPGYNKKSYKNMKCVKISKDKEYPVTLQLAIWKKTTLLAILKKIDKSSPWEFERYFKTSENLKCIDGIVDGVRFDIRDLFGYKNGVLRGKWIPVTVNYYKRQGINIDTNNRGVLAWRKYIIWKIASIVSSRLSKQKKEIIKNFLNEYGIKYI